MTRPCFSCGRPGEIVVRADWLGQKNFCSDKCIVSHTYFYRPYEFTANDYRPPLAEKYEYLLEDVADYDDEKWLIDFGEDEWFAVYQYRISRDHGLRSKDFTSWAAALACGSPPGEGERVRAKVLRRAQRINKLTSSSQLASRR